jgi:hypothetical protein
MSDNMEILIICHLRIVLRLGVLHFYQKIALPIKLADLSDMLKKAFKSVRILTSWYLLNPMTLNQQITEISKWNTPLIICTDHVYEK